MSIIDLLLIIAGVGYLLVRRMSGELLELKRLLVLPAILTVVGATDLRSITSIGSMTVLFAGIGIAVSVALGLLRGRTVVLAERGGHLWMRYTPASVGLWVLNLAVKGALYPLEHAVAPAAGHALLLSVGLGILAESAVVAARALHSGTAVVWEKGRDGAPHTLAPRAEQARAWVESTRSGR